mmetsp:Transcript_15249/g.28706  ORF Transcript_15249/g.28706 Transcript_15249/m.28706 type:complete len:1044 (+) Transcript_15249:75-3206(+)
MNSSNKEICYELLRECRASAARDLESLSSSLLLLRDQLLLMTAPTPTPATDPLSYPSEEFKNVVDNKQSNHPSDPHDQQQEDEHSSFLPPYEFSKLILQLDIVRTGSSSSIEARLQHQLDECLDLCGYKSSFMAAVGILKQEQQQQEEEERGGTRENTSWKKNGTTSTTRVDTKISLSCVLSCLHTIRRYLFSTLTTTSRETKELPLCYKLLHEFLKPWMMHCTNTSDLDRRRLEGTRAFVNFITLLPNQIANVCHKNQMELPSWCTRNKFLKRLVESCAKMVFLCCQLQDECPIMVGSTATTNTTDVNVESALQVGNDLFYVLVEKCLQIGSVECVSSGMYHFWQDTNQMNQDDKDDSATFDCSVIILTNALKRITSPRQSALLLCSNLKYIISQLEMYHTNMTWKQTDLLCREQCLPFVMQVWLPILQSSSMVRDMFVERAVLAPSSSADVSEQKLLVRCVVLLLASCLDSSDDDDDDDDNDDSGNDSDDSDENKEINSSSGTLQNRILMKHLAEVAMVWSETSFVNKTDLTQQRHVSFFILYAIEFMKKEDASPLQQLVVQELLPGVSNRLKTSDRSLRIEGMQIAENLAPILGQTLKFEELDGIREEGDADCTPTETDNKTTHQDYNVDVLNSKTRKVRTVRKRAVKSDIDPDDDFRSDDDDDFSENSSALDDNDSVYSSDSEWDEEGLVSLKLRDDEDDLRVVPVPKYLRECLDLLRADGDDHVAVCKQEAALSELPGLIRALPPDLSDVASSIANELLFMENKFNLSNFSELRWQALIALGACDPVSTIEFLHSQMFSTNMSLGTRFDILDVMKHAAYVLSGQAELENGASRRVEKEKFLIKVAGKRSLVPDEYVRKLEGAVDETVTSFNSEMKTRRWGKGRRSGNKYRSVTNRFGPLSSLFFCPLVQGFLQSKEDEILWGGESGGMLLSHLIMTLAAFVEFSGNHPGTAVLAKDLLELSWSFFCAVNAEVRQAVLIAVSASLPYVPIDYVFSICIGEMQMLNKMQATANFDTSEKCRLLASALLNGLQNSLVPYSR